MWNKIFAVVLALSVIATGFVFLYGYSWLGSIGSPKTAIEGYQFHAALGSNILWASFVLLLIIGNAVLWTSGKVWAMWTAFLYFAVFTLLYYVLLEPSAASFRTSHGIAAEARALGALVGLMLCFVSGAIVYFDSVLNVRLRERMYPPREPEMPEETEPAENPEV